MLSSFTSRTNEKLFPSMILLIISSFKFNWKLLFICCSLIYQVNDKISTHTDCGCADLKDKVLEVILSVFASKAHLKILFYQCSINFCPKKTVKKLRIAIRGIKIVTICFHLATGLLPGLQSISNESLQTNSYSGNVQFKNATEQYFSLMLFILLCNLVVWRESTEVNYI